MPSSWHVGHDPSVLSTPYLGLTFRTRACAGAGVGVIGDGAESPRVARDAPIDPPWPPPLPDEASGALAEPPWPQALLSSPCVALEAQPPSLVTETDEAGVDAGAGPGVGESCGPLLLKLLLPLPLERRRCRFTSAAYCRFASAALHPKECPLPPVFSSRTL